MTFQREYFTTVTAVYQRSLVKHVDKGPNWEHDKSDTIVHRDPPVWHIQCGNWSFVVGSDAPAVESGDVMHITIEKVEQ